MFRYGTEIVPEKSIAVPVEYLMKFESVPGNIYEIRVKFDKNVDVSKAKRLAYLIKKEFAGRFGADVKFVEFNGNTARIQVEGSPFSWSAVLAFLPELFMTVGLVVTLISVVLIISKAPWEVVSFMLGLATAYAGYKLSKTRKEVIGKVIGG